MLTTKYFSFAEIVKGRDASVRVTEDGRIFVVDLAVVVTGKSRDDAAKAIRDLPGEIFPQVSSLSESLSSVLLLHLSPAAAATEPE
jgi:hypothetical protein